MNTALPAGQYQTGHSDPSVIATNRSSASFEKDFKQRKVPAENDEHAKPDNKNITSAFEVIKKHQIVEQEGEVPENDDHSIVRAMYEDMNQTSESCESEDNALKKEYTLESFSYGQGTDEFFNPPTIKPEVVQPPSPEEAEEEEVPLQPPEEDARKNVQYWTGVIEQCLVEDLGSVCGKDDIRGAISELIQNTSDCTADDLMEKMSEILEDRLGCSIERNVKEEVDVECTDNLPSEPLDECHLRNGGGDKLNIEKQPFSEISDLQQGVANSCSTEEPDEYNKDFHSREEEGTQPFTLTTEHYLDQRNSTFDDTQTIDTPLKENVSDSTTLLFQNTIVDEILGDNVQISVENKAPIPSNVGNDVDVLASTKQMILESFERSAKQRNKYFMRGSELGGKPGACPYQSDSTPGVPDNDLGSLKEALLKKAMEVLQTPKQNMGSRNVPIAIIEPAVSSKGGDSTQDGVPEEEPSLFKPEEITFQSLIEASDTNHTFDVGKEYDIDIKLVDPGQGEKDNEVFVSENQFDALFL